MDHSEHERYGGAFNPKYNDPFLVPICVATDDNFKGYGRFVTNFDEEEVEITPWPVHGKHKLCPGTGIFGGVRKDENICYWKDDICYNINKAVPDAEFPNGRLPKDVSPSNRSHVLVQAVNYHPDGGQVFYPEEKKPFILLLALPGDDVTLEDFRAFYFDGSAGVQVHSGVWHQAPYPVEDTMKFRGKQSAVYGCVYCDFADEFNCYVKVPLTLTT